MPFDGTSTYSDVFRAYAIDPNPPQRREAQQAPYVPFEGTSAYKVSLALLFSIFPRHIHPCRR